MEFTGEEKTIQALFNQLRFENDRSVPTFAGIVNSGLAKTNGSRAFEVRLSFKAAILFVGSVLMVVGLIFTYTHQGSSKVANDSQLSVSSLSGPAEEKATSRNVRSADPQERAKKQRARKHVKVERGFVARRSGINRPASSLSRWQSPTISLLHLTANEVLGPAPQLNQSAAEMKTFLASLN